MVFCIKKAHKKRKDFKITLDNKCLFVSIVNAKEAIQITTGRDRNYLLRTKVLHS